MKLGQTLIRGKLPEENRDIIPGNDIVTRVANSLRDSENGTIRVIKDIDLGNAGQYVKLDEEKLAELLFNIENPGMKWDDFSFGTHSEVETSYRLKAKAIAQANCFSWREKE